jgi:hypothetical protein
MTKPGVMKVAGWERYPWLRAGFSTRQGGGTTAYADGGADSEGRGEQNLGWTKEDAAKVVSANRERFVRAVWGAGRQLDPGHPLRGDALMTALPGLLLGVQTADCVPVLLVDTKTRAVAAFHAGWRGTLARIVERGVGTMRLEFGSKAKDLVAAIGPAIAACCFAVGEEVQHEFESQFAYAPSLFSEVYDRDPIKLKYPMLFLTQRAPGHSDLGPQIHLDLHEANRRQLLDAGLRAKAISMLGECTACTRLKDGRRKYFSHRGEHGYTGRMMGVVGVKEAMVSG